MFTIFFIDAFTWCWCDDEIIYEILLAFFPICIMFFWLNFDVPKKKKNSIKLQHTVLFQPLSCCAIDSKGSSWEFNERLLIITKKKKFDRNVVSIMTLNSNVTNNTFYWTVLHFVLLLSTRIKKENIITSSNNNSEKKKTFFFFTKRAKSFRLVNIPLNVMKKVSKLWWARMAKKL